MGKDKWKPVGTVYKKEKSDNGWVVWVIGTAVFLIILAAA